MFKVPIAAADAPSPRAVALMFPLPPGFFAIAAGDAFNAFLAIALEFLLLAAALLAASILLLSD